MTSPTLYLLGELRAARMVLRDALEEERDPDVVAVLDGDVANIVEGLFDGGEVDRPVRCSHWCDGTVPARATLIQQSRAAIVRVLREFDWLAWGGDERPPRGLIVDDPDASRPAIDPTRAREWFERTIGAGADRSSLRDIDYGIALDSPLRQSAIGERRRLDPGVRPLPHGVNLDGMAPGQTTHFEFTHPAQAVEIERHANGWHVVGVTRAGSSVARVGSEQISRDHVRFATDQERLVTRMNATARGERSSLFAEF